MRAQTNRQPQTETRGIMKKNRPKPDTPETDDNDTPLWVADESLDRTTPYTEEELYRLVESTVEGIPDSAAWSNLVDQAGENQACRILRSRIIMQDENAKKLSRH